MSGIVLQEMKKLVAEEMLPGLALRVRQGGKIVLDECVGYADRGNGVKVAADTIYRYCSMSKLITAVGLMQLYEKGLVSLDDSLLSYFPDYPKEKGGITIRHLLNHCCGIGQGEKGNAFLMEHLDMKDKLEDRVHKWGKMPLDYPVGTSPMYCGIVAFDLIGRIIEIVSGQDLETYFRENLFQPLGMKDTCFQLNEEQEKRLAKLYTGQDGTLVETTDKLSIVSSENGYYSGAGGLYGTLNDYDAFTAMIYSGGIWNGNRILQEETLRLMRTPRQIMEKEPVPGSLWGLGFMVFEQPEKSSRSLGAGTFGWSGAYGTHMYIDPKHDLCMTLMAGREDIGGAGSPASMRLETAIYREFCK